MRQTLRILVIALALSSILLSGCGTAAGVLSPSAAKVEAAEVAFTGMIEAINGAQWVVNGQTVTVGAQVAQNNSFKVGDTVKVEASVAADGSVHAIRLETANQTQLAAEAAPASGGIPLVQLPGMAAQGGLVIDNSGDEAFGLVDSITADTIVIGGQVFALASGAEFKDQIQAGDFVKVHFTLNADGTLSITEIEIVDPSIAGNENSNFNGNTNDDDSNGNDDNSNDDNSNDDNSNNDDDEDDDHGGNGNGSND